MIAKNDVGKMHMNLPLGLPSNPKLPAWKSHSSRTIMVELESGETFSFGAMKASTVREVLEYCSEFLKIDIGKIWIMRRDGRGNLMKMNHHEECPGHAVLKGVKSFRKPMKKYEHPVVVVGAGLGGISCMIEMKQRGRQDFICMEKCSDFGGYSWISVPNKFTKLQTERGTYYCEYLTVDANPPKSVGDTGVKYKTWPSRDSILLMMRDGARSRGLQEHTMFNAEIQKIVKHKSGSYAIQWTPSNDDDADGGLQVAAAVISWCGFLHELNTVEWPGEEDFDGYIEYSSFDRFDYTRATGKQVVMYGHGAFTIENVRTLCEFRAKKVHVVCRTRNLCGTKMTSWLVGHLAVPCPATVMLDSFKRMFDLVGYDVWTSPSVVTDTNKSFAYVTQKTIFGVTDIYFLAGYYGLMEVTVDEIKRCSRGAVHTRNKNRRIECDVIIKAIGTAPSWKIAKQLGIKQLVGSWANGDPLRPVSMASKGVAAQNFGSFSFLPGLAPATKMLNWFVDYPDDWSLIKDSVPVNKSTQWPPYVTDAMHPTQVIMIVQSKIPLLAAEMAEMDAQKAISTNQTHPVETYLGEAKAEWEMYIKYFHEHGMIDGSKPDPEYPYTVAMMAEFDRRAEQHWDRQRAGVKPPKELADKIENDPNLVSSVVKETRKKAQTITVKTDTRKTFTFASEGPMKVKEVYELVGQKVDMEVGFALTTMDEENKLHALLTADQDCPSVVYVSGVPSLRPARKEYEHPIVVIGAGLGGVKAMIDLKHYRGRDNFLCLEKCPDFGGHSWIYVPNKFTKLQTERGTYYAEYLNPEASPPKELSGGVKYKTWPSRDSILQMTREFARARGLDEHTRFGTELQKITPKGDAYALQVTKADGTDADDGLLMAGAISAYPGFLHDLNTCEWPGEDEFGGYIEYSSFDRFDYTRTTGKRVVMYGHGAFTIENVRTLMEFRAKKVDIVCRYRNLCGTKMTSWLVGSQAQNCPAGVILDSFKQMFDLVGYDVWKSPSVKTNAKKSFCYIDQKTIFGVTDVYFLAGYYGLMEVTIDEISRCSHRTIHTKNLNKKIECDCVIKAIGTAPSWKIHKQLGIKTVVGQWINGDVYRPVALMTKGVAAQNFGTFSVGPGLASIVKTTNWFLDYPDDYDYIKEFLPVNKQDNWPKYVAEASYPLTMMAAVGGRLPSLATDLAIYDVIKAKKTSESHPLEEYLGQCKAEWEMYTKYFKDNNMVDDRPDCPYPYTIEMVQEFQRRVATGKHAP